MHVFSWGRLMWAALASCSQIGCRQLALTAFFSIAAVLGLTGGTHPVIAQEQEHHAGLVIQFAGGGIETYCLTFAGESISGLDLLLKTGLDVQIEAYGGMGAQICKIGQDGCNYPEQPCACQSYGPGGSYWSYHHLKGGKWVSSSVGASSYTVHDGDVEGWAWSSGKPPALKTFPQLCSTPVPQPVHTTEPPTPKPRPTNTAQPTKLALAPVPTGVKPVPTNTRPPRPTNTPHLLPPSATPTRKVQPTLPKPTPTRQSSATPLRVSATRTNTPVARAATVALTPTSVPSSFATNSVPAIPMITSTSTSTQAPRLNPTNTRKSVTPSVTQPVSTPNPAQNVASTPTVAQNTHEQSVQAENAARDIGIGIGAFTATGLAAWSIAARRRRRVG